MGDEGRRNLLPDVIFAVVILVWAMCGPSLAETKPQTTAHTACDIEVRVVADQAKEACLLRRGVR
jgi:hypothetical protein